MKTLLHVGCGASNITNLPAYFQSGEWDEVRYDIDPGARPDVTGSLQDMSIFEDGAIDCIYSSHNIEHVWAFEVSGILADFHRMLRPDGFALILCPDIISVAQAILAGGLEETLYVSPAGPITAMDILYGWGEDLKRGHHFMAHKTAFSAETLATKVLSAGFAGVEVFRDKVLGLHAVCLKTPYPEGLYQDFVTQLVPPAEYLVESKRFGSLLSE